MHVHAQRSDHKMQVRNHLNDLKHDFGHILCKNKETASLTDMRGRPAIRSGRHISHWKLQQMNHSFSQEKLQELVLYQAVVQRNRTSGTPVVFRKRPGRHAGPPLNPLELNPGVKRIFEKLQRQIFYHSDWWSAIHSDKGLIIDLLA